MNTTPTRELEAQRAVLLRQLRQAGPLVEGAIAMVPRKCGSQSCPCAHGVVKHRAMILCKKTDGRSVATYVPKDLWSTVREWNREHKKIKRVLKELSEINEQIIRNYVGDKRRAAGVRKSLTVVGQESSGEAEP
jgi:hypothetical protein